MTNNTFLPRYEVTRRFLQGTLLEGLIHIETTTVAWKVGQVVRNPIGGSAYEIVAVREIR